MAKYTKRKQRVRRSNLKKTVRGSQRLNRAVNNMKTTKKRRVRRVSRKGRKKSRQSGGTDYTVTEVLELIQGGTTEDTQVTVTSITPGRYQSVGGRDPLVKADRSLKLNLKKIRYLKPKHNDEILEMTSEKAKSEINNELCSIRGDTHDRTENYNLGLLRKRDNGEIYLTVLLVLTKQKDEVFETSQSVKSTGSIKHFYRHIPLEGTISKLKESKESESRLAVEVITGIAEAEAKAEATEAAAEAEGAAPKCGQPARGSPTPPPRVVYDTVGVDGGIYVEPVTGIYAQPEK